MFAARGQHETGERREELDLVGAPVAAQRPQDLPRVEAQDLLTRAAPVPQRLLRAPTWCLLLQPARRQPERSLGGLAALLPQRRAHGGARRFPQGGQALRSARDLPRTFPEGGRINLLAAIDHLFARPATNIRELEGTLGISFEAARRLVALLRRRRRPGRDNRPSSEPCVRSSRDYAGATGTLRR